MSGVTDSHKTAASVQSEKSVESAEPAEIVAVTQGETERRTGIHACASASWAARSTRFTTATWSPPPK